MLFDLRRWTIESKNDVIDLLFGRKSSPRINADSLNGITRLKIICDP
jgi:hypothetical protein